jgi:anti-anti-sigma regulatory factor
MSKQSHVRATNAVAALAMHRVAPEAGSSAGRLLRPMRMATRRRARFTVRGLCTVESQVVPAGASVRLIGQLCYASGPEVRQELIGILANDPIRELDLRGLTFIDLSGIDALCDVVDRIGPSGRPEVHLGARARRLIELLNGMDAPEDEPVRRPDEDRSGAAALMALAARRHTPGR